VIVVDASAFLQVLLRTPESPSIEARLFSGDSLHAPHLIDVEVSQGLRRCAASGQIDSAHGRAALTILAQFPISRYAHRQFLTRVWELRDNFTAYDAMYVALAETLDAPLLTRDRRLAAAAKDHVSVEVV
jgi:predicted nucleic acid-binding protein